MSKFNPTERIGIHRVASILLEKFGWIDREQPIADFGIDMQTEIVETDFPSGQLIALQIKSGPSYFSEELKDCFVFRPEVKHYEYWHNHSLPVVVVLYDTVKHVGYWQHVDYSITEKTGKGWKIKIPKKNTLSSTKDKLVTSIFCNTNRLSIIKENDVSHGGARRLDLAFVVESDKLKSRVALRRLIPYLNQKYRSSDYFRNTQSKERFIGQPVEVIFMFFYHSVSQSQHGLYFCRTVYNHPDCKFPVYSFKPDEVIDGIDVEWREEHIIFDDNIKQNEFSKRMYLDHADRIYNQARTLSQQVQKIQDNYIRSGNFKIFRESLENLDEELRALDNESILHDGFAPMQCRELDRLLVEIVCFLGNIAIVVSDSERGEENLTAVVKMYLNDALEKLPFYPYERKKVR